MRLDRLQRACQHIGQPSSGAYKTDYPSNLMPVFVDIAAAGTIALGTPLTLITSKSFNWSCGPDDNKTLSVREDGTVVNEHGWEQGALNPNGTSKSADDIDFGQDPGTPPPEGASGSRPKRGKDKLFQAAMQIEGEVLSDDDQQSKKWKVRSRAKEKENSDPDDSSYSADVGEDSDSDPEAIMTHEESSHKNNPDGASCRSKDSVDDKPRRKILLDPRFNYKKLRKDYAQDDELSAYLETQKTELRAYFEEHYPAKSPKPTAAAPGPTDGSATRPVVFNFAAYDPGTDDEEENDELDTYFDAPSIFRR
ncbi:hypothetical protein B0H19DRAFT_1265655 [Mycena capillaripes]|nr:hypothetical protein B0H19DRAFT_1265655 [Mycena capillaripes]